MAMMARRFERGFGLVERCRHELPALVDDFPPDSAMRQALGEILEAARKVDRLLRRSGRLLPAEPPDTRDA
ncbi:MAG: hypothetical protein JO111_19285 [Caulobacteraceae bacterium]|nr:hypothetical protein [Caulobacteraceae bacterium]